MPYSYKQQCVVFHFMFYAVHLMIWNLIIVSKSNLEWKCLLVFNLEKPLMEKLKLEAP